MTTIVDQPTRKEARLSTKNPPNGRYYTESEGPDPNMTPYYQSVPMAMWVTMLNLAGEAPLCDYTVWGKVQ